MCDETFDQTFKLELHLRKHDIETFKCEKCDKTFQLKWRLEKHRKAHDMSNSKFCHYFNNQKYCPFEEIGCMYTHAKSKACRFGNICTKKLCQFQHFSDESIQEDGNNAKNNMDKIVDNESRDSNNFDKDQVEVDTHLENNLQETIDSDSEEEEEEEEDLECELCGKVCDDFDSYLEHSGMGDCVVYCNHCDKTFKEEVDLKKHIEKHCTKCGKEFSAVNALKSHQKRCT